jgi:hypothetical protein
MTLLADPPDTATEEKVPQRLWMPAVLGLAGAMASLLIVIGATLVIWSVDNLSPGTPGQAAGLGSSLWLALGGTRLHLAATPVGFVPLALAALPWAGAFMSLQWVLRRRGESDGWIAGLLAAPVLRLIGIWWGGYAAGVGLAVALSTLGPASALSWTLVGPILLVPLLACAVALGREARDDEWLLGPRLDGSALPVWVRRALRPALWGTAVLLAIGAVLVVSMVALSWDRVVAVQTAIGGGAMAALTTWLVQGASLPNLALWALSFLAGPGVSVVDGASLTWSGSSSGLLPLVPVFAALPQPGAFPWFMVLVVIVPILCGGFIGRRALAGVARLSALRTKLLVAGSAAVGTAILIGALDLVGGATLGAYRLSDVGAPAGWLTLALAGELLVGALLHAVWDAWRLRR